MCWWCLDCGWGGGATSAACCSMSMVTSSHPTSHYRTYLKPLEGSALVCCARHILQLVVAFQDDQEVVLVQPYAAGGDLLKLLRSWGGTLGEREAVRGVVGPLLQALVYLHSHGILHRWEG